MSDASSRAGRGVIVDFDFAVLDGASLLFETARRHLKALDGIALDEAAEARFLTGRAIEEGLAALFASVGTKKTARKAARDLVAAFRAAVADAAPKAVDPAFCAFASAMAARGVQVVVSTCADASIDETAFAPLLADGAAIWHDEPVCYGFPRWDAWSRACRANGLRRMSAAALAGSGFAVKSALLAGIRPVAVLRPRTAWQDFTGADAVVETLSAAEAGTVFGVLRM